MSEKKKDGDDPLVLALLRQVLGRLDETNVRIDETRKEVGETRKDLGGRIDQTNARIDETNARMDARIDETNARMDARFDGLAADVKAVDVSLGTLRQDMEPVADQQATILTELAALRGEAHRDLADHRVRIEQLEKRKRTGT